MQTEWERAKEEGRGERVDGEGDNLKRRQETEGKKKINAFMLVFIHLCKESEEGT